MVERRRFKRLDISIPLSIKLSGTTVSLPPIDVETDNISLEGLGIGVKIRIGGMDRWLPWQVVGDSMMVLHDLLRKDRTLELRMNILPEGRSLGGIGKVMWHDTGLRGEFYHLRAGILIEEMETGHSQKWLEFLRTVYPILSHLRDGGG